MTDNEIRSWRISLQSLLDDCSIKLETIKAAMEMLLPDAQAVITTGQEPVNQMIACITSDPTLGASPAAGATQPTV